MDIIAWYAVSRRAKWDAVDARPVRKTGADDWELVD